MSLSRIRKRNGRSALKTGVNGIWTGAAVGASTITALAAAASVPFSVTSTKALRLARIDHSRRVEKGTVRAECRVAHLVQSSGVHHGHPVLASLAGEKIAGFGPRFEERFGPRTLEMNGIDQDQAYPAGDVGRQVRDDAGDAITGVVRDPGEAEFAGEIRGLAWLDASAPGFESVRGSHPPVRTKSVAMRILEAMFIELSEAGMSMFCFFPRQRGNR